ncbi:hypothetical protein [Liberiplasma polymorphum]|uniref:hypothetical protein n=1 Tax=Liberiplasma polymorphum TaxID=3374570 RepID=UPI0037734F5E
MHTMKHDSKLLTTIGLIFEGLLVLLSIVITLVLLILPTQFFYEAFLTDFPAYNHDALIILTIWRAIFAVITIVGIILFIVNFILFTKLMKNEVRFETASVIYTYQLIIGIIYLFGNTLVGILYLVSSLFGKRTLNEEKFQR